MKTKEQLVKENGVLAAKIETLENEDKKRRETLSGLLDSFEWETNTWSSNNTRKINVRDWLGIAFLIGELKSDADYSILVEQRKNNERTIQELSEKIYKLEHPEMK